MLERDVPRIGLAWEDAFIWNTPWGVVNAQVSPCIMHFSSGIVVHFTRDTSLLVEGSSF